MREKGEGDDGERLIFLEIVAAALVLRFLIHDAGFREGDDGERLIFLEIAATDLVFRFLIHDAGFRLQASDSGPQVQIPGWRRNNKCVRLGSAMP